MTALREILEVATNGGSLSDLTVLAPMHDPYRLDTPAKHRDGAWLAEQIENLRIRDPIHLRGLHYALVSGELLKPNGKPYTNTEADWTWLGENAAKAARWLGYVRFGQLIDARNEAPIINRRDDQAPEVSVLAGRVEVRVPEIDQLKPEVFVEGFVARQHHHLVFFGEKTSLNSILAAAAKRYHADLYLPAGEISDTMLWQMARDGAADARPMVVFTISDCDPAGWQMPVSIGHKLRALRDLQFPDLEFEVRPIALTVEQVRAHGLPSTPLKETERRASRWRDAFGVEQTEIDALATLRPELLRRIVDDAVAPFFDHTLSARVAGAESRWLAEAQQALEEQIDMQLLAQLREQAVERMTAIEPQLELVNQALREASTETELDLPQPIVPSAELNSKPCAPLVFSGWPFEQAARALIARKRYAAGQS